MILSFTAAGGELLRSRRNAKAEQPARALSAEFTPEELGRLSAAAPLIERLAAASVMPVDGRGQGITDGVAADPDDCYRWVVLANTTATVFMSQLDGSIVLISLPAIFRGIHLDPLASGNISYLLWMLMGYRLVQAVLVVTVGRLETCMRRGFAVGLNQVAGLSGMFIGLVAGGVLASLDWRLVFWSTCRSGSSARCGVSQAA